MTKTTRYISKRQEWESKQSKLNTSSLDYMGQKTSETITFFDRDIKGNIIERPKQITVYKHSNYSNVYVETNSKNSQNISKYLNKKINIDKEYGLLDKIVILKNKTLEGYAAYNNNINVFYISEELINHEEFKK